MIKSHGDYVLNDMEQNKVNQFDFGTEANFALHIFRRESDIYLNVYQNSKHIVQQPL